MKKVNATMQVALLLLITVLSPRGVVAQETEREKELQQRVETLESRLARVEKLLAQIEDRPAQPPVVTAPSTDLEKRVADLEETTKKIEGPNIMLPQWEDGLRMTTGDGKHEIKIGGRIHNDWLFGDESDAIASALGEIDDGVEFRRARLYLAGHFYDRFDFTFQYDFAGGDADFKDVYFGINDLTPWGGGLRIGQFKEPFSLEELTSSNYITFLERGLPNALVPSRSTGAMLYNSLCDDRVAWAVGLFRDSDDFADRSESGDGNGEYNMTGRLTTLPYYANEGRQLLHLGAAFSHRNPNDDMLRYRRRPEAHLANRFVDTGTFGSDEVNLYGAEAALVWGPLSIQGEYITAEAEATGGMGDPDFQGYYVNLSYFLTGEHRPYERTEGVFGRIKPKRNYLEDGGPGAWEATARYSSLDLDDAFLAGGELKDLTLGLNWYWNPNARVMFNYVRADVDRGDLGLDDDANLFQLRFQFDF